MMLLPAFSVLSHARSVVVAPCPFESFFSSSLREPCHVLQFYQGFHHIICLASMRTSIPFSFFDSSFFHELLKKDTLMI
jgi:hypothetical protein